MRPTILFLISLVITVAASCSTNGDCPGGCCHENKCFTFQNISEPCHLPSKTVNVMLYPCGCAKVLLLGGLPGKNGLVCDEIHFDPNLPSQVHQAEQILLGHGYGLCTDSPGTLFGK